MAEQAAKECTLQQVIGKLKSSPMFQLSLASKELFHSNFLAWLCETYPAQVGKLFAEFVRESPTSYTGLGVDREKGKGKRKIDLWLTFANGQELIIENKVKSVPTRRQLDEIAMESPGGRTSFLLLSLCAPSFEASKWQTLCYSDLLVKLCQVQPEIASRNDYHGELLRDYINFIWGLVFVYNYFRTDWNETEEDFLEAEEEVGELTRIRLHDLILKQRYSELASQIATALRANGYVVAQDDDDAVLRTLRPGEVIVRSGFTNGHAYAEFRYALRESDSEHPHLMLGVAVQGRDFRLSAYAGGHRNACSDVDDFASRLSKTNIGDKLWFDFGPVREYSDSSERPYKRGDRNFGTFEDTTWKVLYRYTRLTAIPPARLVEVIVNYADSIRANERALREQIKL
jgi:hypothetical protein